MTEETAVSVRELAQILGVSADTVYSMARSREIPGVRVGRLWRFWPSEVRAHLEHQAAERDPWATNARMRGAHRGWESRRARARS